MDNEKQAMALKIKALLAKTMDNGCSEAEAMMAAAKARELMDKYHIGMSEVEVKAEGTTEIFTTWADGYEALIARGLGVAIGYYTDTKCWLSGGEKLAFFGFVGDVGFADWLHKSLRDYIMRNLDTGVLMARFDGAVGGTVVLKKSFILGCCDRISKRLWEDRDAQKQKIAGQGLVLLDRAVLMREEFAKKGLRLRLRSGKAGARAGDVVAFGAGQSVGDSARWDRPVNGGGGVKQLA